MEKGSKRIYHAPPPRGIRNRANGAGAFSLPTAS